jgi:hypothetical protein
MRSWSLKEARLVCEWAHQPNDQRTAIEELARLVGRTPAAIKEFLRRALPPAELPWRRKPRWKTHEVEVLRIRGEVESRSRNAITKFIKRAGWNPQKPEDEEQPGLTVSQVAADLGISRRRVYELIECDYLRRFKGRIAESSFEALIRDHPEVIPFHSLPPAHKEWLVVMGYKDDTMKVKMPSVRGLLKERPDPVDRQTRA